MIITRLLGGLGNQMFQYASAYAVAKKNNTKLGIDTDWFVSKNSSVWHMSYELDCFNISAIDIKPMKYSIKNDGGKAKRLTALFTKNNVVEYREDGMLYDPKVFEAGPNVVLEGYWQSEKYFKNIRADILREFTFREKLSGNNIKTHNLISQTNAVSLHVRRGDYATHPQTNAVHGLMGLDYYAAAINSINKRVKNAHYFVFSDDPEWCSKNLPIEQPHTYVIGNKKGCYDMQLMSLCNHHVLANSSFSWWGAWLNVKPDKIIIAPKRWFNDPTKDARDLVLESWEKL